MLMSTFEMTSSTFYKFLVVDRELSTDVVPRYLDVGVTCSTKLYDYVLVDLKNLAILSFYQGFKGH